MSKRYNSYYLTNKWRRSSEAKVENKYFDIPLLKDIASSSRKRRVIMSSLLLLLSLISSPHFMNTGEWPLQWLHASLKLPFQHALPPSLAYFIHMIITGLTSYMSFVMMLQIDYHILPDIMLPNLGFRGKAVGALTPTSISNHVSETVTALLWNNAIVITTHSEYLGKWSFN